jgi:hypothetical protein
MGISRALDSNNDIFVQNGRIEIASNGGEVVQRVRTRLQFYLEEWFLDQAAGTPWLQEIFIKPINLNNIESLIKARIALTPGVRTLLEFSLELDSQQSRKLNISFSAETTYGEIINEEVFING